MTDALVALCLRALAADAAAPPASVSAAEREAWQVAVSKAQRGCVDCVAMALVQGASAAPQQAAAATAAPQRPLVVELTGSATPELTEQRTCALPACTTDVLHAASTALAGGDWRDGRECLQLSVRQRSAVAGMLAAAVQMMSQPAAQGAEAEGAGCSPLLPAALAALLCGTEVERGVPVELAAACGQVRSCGVCVCCVLCRCR